MNARSKKEKIMKERKTEKKTTRNRKQLAPNIKPIANSFSVSKRKLGSFSTFKRKLINKL